MPKNSHQNSCHLPCLAVNPRNLESQKSSCNKSQNFKSSYVASTYAVPAMIISYVEELHFVLQHQAFHSYIWQAI
ncbi:hypothetical protein Plhal304r1_c028g0092081 [Plasmopara halstedii]